jgi:acetyl-CoA carboxylase biotin carboxyl carrier protein
VKRKPADAAHPPAKGGLEADNFIPFEQIQALIDLLEERGLEEFELEREGVRIRIKRRGAAAPAPAFVHAAGNSPVREAAAAPPEAPAEAEDVHVVKSPIVGTFYAAPRPDAPPFVKPGDSVEVGQVLCIIEAMKLMNEIEADVAGEIVRIYAENAQPVEYGESLFAIRPRKK